MVLRRSDSFSKEMDAALTCVGSVLLHDCDLFLYLAGNPSLYVLTSFACHRLLPLGALSWDRCPDIAPQIDAHMYHG